MVWSLCPVDPLSGDEKYYIYCNGTYTVGRKGCDVIVKSDKSVSREHAQISVGFKDGTACSMCIQDCSKYGTFITRQHDLKEKVNDFPNRQINAEDGDLISFGTGNAIYRLSFIRLVFFFYPTDSSPGKTCEKAVSIGARIVNHLSDDCTHVVVPGVLQLNDEFLDIIISQKPVVLPSWVDILAEKNIRPEFVSSHSYTPSINFQGISVKLTEPNGRANCLQGYTCIINSKDKYWAGKKLPSLLQICGSLTVSVEDFCQDSQESKVDLHNQLLYVLPTGSSDTLSAAKKFHSLYEVKEVDLLYAVFSGHLDSSILISPPDDVISNLASISVIVSSSCSTDDTVVADSDAETETAASEECMSIRIPETIEDHVDKVEITSEHKETSYISPSKQFKDLDNKMTTRSPTEDVLGNEKCDIIYSLDLITRYQKYDQLTLSASSDHPNYKCFKRKNSQSGNSFSNLIPYSKNPYRDSDYESKYSGESITEEKKRKQMEAIAEDLFNHDKPRRKAVAGALQGLLYTR